jgi:GNAT superfamily N-acetyltransferase
MTIRPAAEQDIPGIVELLKLSLGESLMPKSEAFWRWKHIDNPFGRSPVLLAFENEKLIGIRAFMRWEWRQGLKVFKAVRAVDTATHPEYQGRGIFKKLTLALVDQCKAQGTDFIFNTPNKSSRPGYLKMGWKPAGNVKLYTRPVLNMGSSAVSFEKEYAVSGEKIEQMHSFSYPDEALITNYSLTFLKWRYENNPNVRYFMFTDSKKQAAVFFRLKKNRFLTELRICDLFIIPTLSPAIVREPLRKAIRDSGATVITCGGAAFPFLVPRLAIGPKITVRPLSTGNSLSFESWKPSLGDMEVF